MSSCWKCGNAAQDGQVECEKCRNVNVTFTETQVRFKKIDWDKVTNFEQMKEILSCLQIRVVVGSPDYEKLGDYLQD